ncbi:hypothetical protein NC653_015700 [Populus alba x Populus x berolinensis]|uniref:Uncharacterized protein n=1 Tax=Populus alba x Populus x berolinensis TaxID=444605 RepID=A0AAD6QL47_9ROSI|nr:hypothetical protein NC653_015700 [Populus alba x Populus x berolinensis]
MCLTRKWLAIARTLQMGKQQKMSHVMSVQLRQESLMNVPFQKYDDKARKATNPFLDQNLIASPQIAPVGTVQMQCATEYQHLPDLFRLPASSPFDNFLKAAVTARGRCLAICFLPSGPARVLWSFKECNIMSTKYIVSSSSWDHIALAYVGDYVVSDKKIFGGLQPRTRLKTRERLGRRLTKKFQAWPRTGGHTSGDESKYTRQKFHCYVPRFLNPILACDLSVSVRILGPQPLSL